MPPTGATLGDLAEFGYALGGLEGATDSGRIELLAEHRTTESREH
jgi:hypothetical protein